MSTYIIDYDLRGQRDYEELYDAIANYSTHARILESTWAVVSSLSASEVYDNLAQHIDSDDGLIVVKTAGEAKWKNVLCSSQWLKDHI